ncbi:MAG: serine/threonine-protein kinase [Mariprofundaceae bacterium]|nr:serine/threonine-protein kinase [Mariprofundaceae bacterium]
MKNNAFWKADWLIGLVLTMLFCFLYIIGFSPLKSLDFAVYDTALSMNKMPADDRIVIVDIDDTSIDKIGRWPWSRTVIGDMIHKLSDASARSIGVDVFFSEKQENNTLSMSVKLASVLRKQGNEIEAVKVEEEALAHNPDYQLVNAVKHAKRVYMPMFFEEGEPLGRPDGKIPAYLKRMEVLNIVDDGLAVSAINATKLHAPFPELATMTKGLGFLNASMDDDGQLRSEPMVVNYFGHFFPSLALVMAMSDLNLTMNDMSVNLGTSVQLGALNIKVDDKMRMYPAFHGDMNGVAFKHYSFYDVLSNKIPSSVFKNKIVLIGVTAAGLGSTYMTPVNSQMTGVEFHANVLQSLLDESFYEQANWGYIAAFLLILLVGLYLSLALPRMTALWGAVSSFVLLLLLVVGTFYTLMGYNLWLQTMSAVVLLVFGYGLLTTKRFFASEDARDKISADSVESNKMLGLSFQSQGMLDLAFEKFRKCPVEDVAECLYNLGLDFERKRQFNKATSVYEHISEQHADYKDVKERISRMKDAESTMIFGASSAGGSVSSLLLTGGTKPVLGRYEIIRELGKGAMGIVYLGKDPKINREVAIKTMALAQEFEPDEMKDVKDRFFREAETAGRLNHPNIVTMYDAGEEHDLAYIAMEFLDGSDLSPYTKKGKLFPAMATLKICGKVADALNYANSQQVVHRDIKPANIMLLKNKSIMVTDFGIARITASSKTKTGVVLGTPSYMSPEQLSGKHVDGRSDLFSLGVMMYEMLCGVRPFRGDSMATLMFQIANEPHPDIREYNEAVPASVAKLLDHMLAKDPNDRVANGAVVIREIVQCLREMSSAGRN